MTDLVLICVGGVPICWGVAAAFARRVRLAWWLLLTGNAIHAAVHLASRQWLFAAVNVAAAVFCAWMLWRNRRRRKRAPRAYGAKSAALLAALTRKARDAARPRPVPRLAPQGTG